MEVKNSPNYQVKTDKYTALYRQSKDVYQKKLVKKADKHAFWQAMYRLWSYKGCMTRNVLPHDCDENKCEKVIWSMFARYSNKVNIMQEIVADAAREDPCHDDVTADGQA